MRLPTRLALSGFAAGLLVACSGTPPQPPAPTTNAAPVQSEPAPVLEAAQLGTIERVHRFGDVWLASQPAAADYAAAKAAGVRTLVNLRPDAEQPGVDEAALAQQAGLAYVHLPVASPGGFDDLAFDQARRLLTSAERPLLVHCHSANRVGAAWLVWRVLDGGLALEPALAEAKAIGLKNPATEAQAREYLARHGAGK